MANSSMTTDSELCSKFLADGIKSCPFLRNISLPTNFNLEASIKSQGKGSGPIFEDIPNFESSFKLFHGRGGLVPLIRDAPSPASPKLPNDITCPVAVSDSFEASLSACTAAISISAFGSFNPFGFESFRSNHELRKADEIRKQQEKDIDNHEAFSNEWLATGNCPIAKSYRAISCVLPAVSKILTASSATKLKCPAAIVAARAALSKVPAVKALRPKALPVKLMAVGSLGMGLNIPLGMWREHCEKFSLQWILAVHAAVPFVAMLRKAVVMPKYVIAFTIATCIVGQTIGSRLERRRIKHRQLAPAKGLPSLSCPPATALSPSMEDFQVGTCSGDVAKSHSLEYKVSAGSSSVSVY